MELEDLITSFKSANQSLRKRAVALGVLMILAVSLRYGDNARYEKISGLIVYQQGLEKIAALPDSTFCGIMDGEIDTEEYLPLTELGLAIIYPYRLFQKVKLSNYKRELVVDEIGKIDGQIESENQKKSISLLGLSIPLEPVAYLSLVFVLILFHDFTQIIMVRNYIYRRIRAQKLPQWKLGTEFFGFYNPASNSALKFVRFTSSLITGILILSPLVTSYLMMAMNNSCNNFLFVLNVICFLLIVIDTIIIFHTENIARFRYFSNFYLGRHRTGKFTMLAVWTFSFTVFIGLNLVLSAVLIERLGTPGILYCLMTIVPPLALYLALIFTQKNPTKTRRAIRAGLLILNLFVLLVTYQSFVIIDRFSQFEVQEVKELFICVFLFCVIYAFLYMRFFMDGKKPLRKLN